MIRILYCLTLLFFFSSCNKDEPTGITDPMEMNTDVTLQLLKEIRLNDILINSYIYNADSTVLQSTSYSNSSGEIRFIDDYSYQGNVIECTRSLGTGEINSSIKYSRVSDVQSLQDFFDADGEKVGFNDYTFDDNHCGYSDLSAVDALGNLKPSTRIEYIDENCSAVHYSKYADNPEYIRWEYTRNDKYNAMNSTILPFFNIERQNGIIKQVRKTPDGTVSTNLSYDAEIEYNEFDFPTKETQTYLDGDIIEYSYTYYQ